MLRSTRTIAALMRSLIVGTAVTVATATAATTIVGCKDESQPDYWIEKLADPPWRPRAIKRLEQFFEDAATRSNNDLQNAEVKALLDKIVGPLTDIYVANHAELDTKSRVALIKLLAATRDARAEPALKTALEEYAKRPRRSKDDSDIKWVVRAQADMNLDGLAQPMVDAFSKFRASTMLGGITYKDFSKAIVTTARKDWVGPMLKLLEPPIERPKNNKEKDKLDVYRDQVLWQTTAAQVLGKVKATEAIEPLLKTILDPTKGDVAKTALLALVKIGQPAIDRTIKLLKDEDTGLKEFHLAKVQKATKAKKPPTDDPHVRIAAQILGTMGNPAAIPHLIAVANKADKEGQKAVILAELAKIPATAESKKAFMAAYNEISLDSATPATRDNAMAMLTDAAATFYDATLIDALFERAESIKGDKQDKKGLQALVATAGIKLMTPKQVPQVDAFVKRNGTKLEKDNFKLGEAMVKACGDKVACYLEQIGNSENQDAKTYFKGIKAAYMIGVYGDDKTRDELVKKLQVIEKDEVRFAAMQTIDKLAPKGSKETADVLEAMITKKEESGDKDATLSALKNFMYRIRARAGG